MSENSVKAHPGVAAVFSFIFSGLGQIYNGQIAKGLVIIFLSAVNMLIFLVGSVIMGAFFLKKLSSLPLFIAGLVLFVIGLFFICIVGIYSIFDAYSVSSKK